jgi:hypothetical protein
MRELSGIVLLIATALASCSSSSAPASSSDNGAGACSMTGTYVLNMQIATSNSTVGCAGQTTGAVMLSVGTDGTATVSGAPDATISPTADGGTGTIGGPAGCSWITTTDPYECTLLVTCSGPGVGQGTAESGDSGDNSDSFVLETDAQNAVTGSAIYGSLCAWTVTGQRTP